MGETTNLNYLFWPDFWTNNIYVKAAVAPPNIALKSSLFPDRDVVGVVAALEPGIRPPHAQGKIDHLRFPTMSHFVFHFFFHDGKESRPLFSTAFFLYHRMFGPATQAPSRWKQWPTWAGVTWNHLGCQHSMLNKIAKQKKLVLSCFKSNTKPGAILWHHPKLHQNYHTCALFDFPKMGPIECCPGQLMT